MVFSVSHKTMSARKNLGRKFQLKLYSKFSGTPTFDRPLGLRIQYSRLSSPPPPPPIPGSDVSGAERGEAAEFAGYHPPCYYDLISVALT